MTPDYSAHLALTLDAGVRRLPLSFRSRQVRFLTTTQRPDGGFSGRLGPSNLYYTAFALRSATLLELNDPHFYHNAAHFLSSALSTSHPSQSISHSEIHNPSSPPPRVSPAVQSAIRNPQSAVLSIPDAFSLLLATHLLEHCSSPPDADAARRQLLPTCLTTLESFRIPTGGFGRHARPLSAPSSHQPSTGLAHHPSGGPAHHHAAGPDHSAPSIYHTFLAGLCYQLLDRPLPESDAVAQWLLARQLPTGGFSDSPRLRDSATNPTAAAVVLLALLDHLTPHVADRASSFLLSMQHPSGGFLAHSGSPAPDLLSTFTALVALHDISALDQVKLSTVARFVRDLSLPDGSFSSSTSDPNTDVEYLYYGLGSLALLATLAPTPTAVTD